MIATERFACAALLAVTLLGRSAHAADEAAGQHAQELFDRAVAALEAGDFATACPALAESQRLDPAGGTVLNLAYCLEKTHDFRSAAERYREALARADADARPDRHELALAGLNRTLALQPRVRLVFAEGRPSDLQVTLDDAALALEQLDYPVPLATGTHQVRITRSGHVPVTLAIEANAAIEYVLRVPQLAPAAPPEAPARDSISKKLDLGSPSAATASKRSAAPSTAASRALAPHHRSTAFWLTATGSGALLVGGGVAGILAATHHQEAVDACPGGKCSAAGVADERSANRWAWGANIGLGLGLVGAAVAVYLFEKPAERTALRSPLEVSF